MSGSYELTTTSPLVKVKTELSGKLEVSVSINVYVSDFGHVSVPSKEKTLEATVTSPPT